MAITISAVTPNFVAEIGDVDLRWVRDMHRAMVSDIANTCEQEKLDPTTAR